MPNSDLKEKIEKADSRVFYLYKIENVANGKFYIGLTGTSIEQRFGEHLRSVRGASKSILYKAIRKYGKECFKIIVLCTETSPESAKAKEIELIAKLQPHYNLTKGGDGTLGLKASEERRKKISAALLLNPTRYWLGKKRSQETKDKISLKKNGIPNPKNKGNVQPHVLEAAAIARRIPIRCLTTGEVFTCAKEAAEKTEFTIHQIRDSCRRGNRCQGTDMVFSHADV